MKLNIGPRLFSFDNFTSWLNHASTAWEDAGVRPEDTLAVDQAGRVVKIGKHYMQARDEEKFPVDVYQLRPDY